MSSKLKSFMLTALLIALVSGLNAQSPVTPDSTVKKPPVRKLGVAGLRGKWYLIPALDSDTASGHLPEISFDITKLGFTGNTGCNRMSGTFTATDDSLNFSDKMITTRMSCVGYNESAFLQNLLRVDTYKFRKGVLVLMVNGVEVSRWMRKAATPKKTGKA
jgi:heat shock protein HslJ